MEQKNGKQKSMTPPLFVFGCTEVLVAAAADASATNIVCVHPFYNLTKNVNYL